MSPHVELFILLFDSGQDKIERNSIKLKIDPVFKFNGVFVVLPPAGAVRKRSGGGDRVPSLCPSVGQHDGCQCSDQ